MSTASGQSVADAASLELPKSAARFFRAGRKAFERGDPETLHEFRIAAKRFRYALELFEPVYGPKLKAKLKSLKRLQDALGSLNDIVTARTLIGEGAEADDILECLEKRESSVRAELDQCWTKDFSPRTPELAWRRYLARYVIRPKGAVS